MNYYIPFVKNIGFVGEDLLAVIKAGRTQFMERDNVPFELTSTENYDFVIVESETVAMKYGYGGFYADNAQDAEQMLEGD